MSATKYLLFKVSVLEHVASNEVCRISEDILTVICEPPPTPPPSPPPQGSPLPTATPTPTPTKMPSVVFNDGLFVPGSNSTFASISGNGITLTAVGGTSFSYNIRTDSYTMSTLSLRRGNPSSFIELASLVFIDAYMGSQFRITINGTSYLQTFTNGVAYI